MQNRYEGNIITLAEAAHLAHLTGLITEEDYYAILQCLKQIRSNGCIRSPKGSKTKILPDRGECAL